MGGMKGSIFEFFNRIIYTDMDDSYLRLRFSILSIISLALGIIGLIIFIKFYQKHISKNNVTVNLK